MNTNDRLTGSNFKLPDEKRQYLGDTTVVESLVRDFVSDICNATTAGEARVAIDKKALIFCGMDPDFEIVDGWNERLQLGMVVSGRIGIDPNQDWMSIMRAGLASLAIEIRGIIRNNVDEPIADWGWQIDAQIEFWTSMLVGTIDITHPTDTIG